MKWLSALLTDRQDNPDTGRVLVPIAALAVLFIAGWDVIQNGNEFDPQGLGIGLGGILAGFAAYLIGDRPMPLDTKRK